jgi:hypothetical protein
MAELTVRLPLLLLLALATGAVWSTPENGTATTRTWKPPTKTWEPLENVVIRAPVVAETLFPRARYQISTVVGEGSPEALEMASVRGVPLNVTLVTVSTAEIAPVLTTRSLLLPASTEKPETVCEVSLLTILPLTKSPRRLTVGARRSSRGSRRDRKRADLCRWRGRGELTLARERPNSAALREFNQLCLLMSGFPDRE